MSQKIYKHKIMRQLFSNTSKEFWPDKNNIKNMLDNKDFTIMGSSLDFGTHYLGNDFWAAYAFFDKPADQDLINALTEILEGFY